MILTGSEITKNVASGKIVISPFRDSSVNPNSYNYHLGAEIKVIPNGTFIDPKSILAIESTSIDENGIILLPGNVYLGVTEEKIGSNEFVVSLIGRSSIGRLGLFVQISAELGNLGICHKWTLELLPIKPIRVYPGMPIGQVSFWKPKGKIRHYEGTLGTLDAPSLPDSKNFDL